MEKKQTLLLTVIAVATLLVAVVGATFAYFTAQGGTSSDTQINVITSTTASSEFVVDSNLTITANQTNFGLDDKSISGYADGTVKYTSSNAATGADLNYCYTVSLNINSNSFVENPTSGAADLPELLFKVSKNNTEIITGVTGLTYSSVPAANNLDNAILSGFDVTTATGNHQIGGIHKIETSQGGSETHTWHATVTLVNLNVDQVWNAGKSFDAKLVFTKSNTCD